MPSIAILYIAIGPYEAFWKPFRASCERYFLPGCSKTYFVFTDSKRIRSGDHLVVTTVGDEGWPANTLHRFHFFLRQSMALAAHDYCFFFNANALFVKPVLEEEVLPGFEEDYLVGLSWSLGSGRNPDAFPYDRNPASTAYIPLGQGRIYYQGGLIGGSCQAFLAMTNELAFTIDQDARQGITALHNDESHLNHYLLDKKPRCLSTRYGRPQEWDTPSDPSMLFVQKERVLSPFYLFKLKRKPWQYLLKSWYGRVKCTFRRNIDDNLKNE